MPAIRPCRSFPRWRVASAIRASIASSKRWKGGSPGPSPAPPAADAVQAPTPLLPASRRRYLAEIAETVRDYRAETARVAEQAGLLRALARALEAFGAAPPAALASHPPDALAEGAAEPVVLALRRRYEEALAALPAPDRAALAAWPARRARYREPTQEYVVRERSIAADNYVETLSQLRLPRVALPRTEEWSDLSRYLRLENTPGAFPFTAGVFPFRRDSEDPTRMFAGEGTPERTNRRFHLLCADARGARLSTAFDSVTLYGRDPDERPDIYGKVGNSGVSVCCLDDAKKLYSGFDLCDPSTSVSMTINGPAPMVLAFFLNAAVDQAVEKSPARTRRARVGAGALRERRSSRATACRCRRATTASASACWASPATRSCLRRPTRGSRARCSARSAERSRPTS